MEVAPTSRPRALPRCSPSPSLELVEVGNTCCWGAMLGSADCTPNFVPGKLHFKNKFCANCKEGILVPLAQVRAITAEQAAYFINRFSIKTSLPAGVQQSGLVGVRARGRARRHELC